MTGARIRSAAGSGDTNAKDICGETTGNSDGVGGHPDYFRCVCVRERVRSMGENTCDVVEEEGSGGTAECHSGSDFGSGNFSAAT